MLFPRTKYNLIMADPPWRFKVWSGEAISHYSVMSLDDIKRLPVSDIAAPDCLLWLWATHPMLPQALEVMQSWGFTFKTSGVWNKTTSKGNDAFGQGYILRSSSEPFLIGTIGKPKTTRSTRTGFRAPKRAHSQKPEEAFQIAESLMPGAKRIELFSRTWRAGWDTWGNEVGSID